MIKGKIYKFGANVDTDAIIPSRYANLITPSDLGKHCMEGIAPDFAKEIRPGDIIMAASNFGCGSSREQAPISIKGAGVSCVIAKTFARIFFRNAINISLPLLECPEAVDHTDQGDELEIDLASGKIRNITKDTVFTVPPYPDFIRGIIDAGGLIKYTIKKREAGR
ncbi:MAG: 3-isopropylmalate dehydratase small subunit [Deltaproteobacteria bacterium]|nr:3-isopropylmalate dehydratase small subunit [Deltaproteobacteria bacterium]